MRDYQTIVKELDADLPRSAVHHREGGGGIKLSYVTGHYVIDRLNKIVGIGRWAYSHKLTQIADASGMKKDSRGIEKYNTAYLAEVRLVVDLGGVTTEFTEVGYGNGRDSDPGKAHESATKEAVTDGLKRAAKNLGMSLGLALYDKTQENVSDEPKKAVVDSVDLSTSSKPAGENILKTSSLPNEDRRTLNDTIRATSERLIKQGLASRDQLYQLMGTFGAKTKEELSDANAYLFLKKMKEMGSENAKQKQ